jgi:AcrR family transcriptional regulator
VSQVRERILGTASELFYNDGIQAVGIDAIIRRADVARMSFYRHFASKEGLVLAYLERHDAQFRAWLEAEVVRRARRPADRPLAIFDALAVRIVSENYRGCAFVNAMAETADRDAVVHRAAAAHKAKVGDYIARVLKEAGHDPRLAPDLLLLVDGAVVAAVREGSARPARRARRLAALLLGSPRRRA